MQRIDRLRADVGRWAMSVRALCGALLAVCMAFGLAPIAAAEEGVPLDHFPSEKLTDLASLQNGAKLFVNYCLNCHAASYMRYNRLRDIGLTEADIKKNLLFATDKVGDTMKVALDPKQAKEWFGAQPPDLTVITRARSGERGSGADYVYTYLRSYYRDDTRPTGWNNLVYPNVAMPNVLWQLQGQRTANFVTETDPHEPGVAEHHFEGFTPTSPGLESKEQFDDSVADIVAYLQWMSEPAHATRLRIGVWVLIFLAIFTIVAWRLNAAYWSVVK